MRRLGAVAMAAAVALGAGCQAAADPALRTPATGSWLAIAPDNLATLWLVSPRGTYRSPDGGHSWYRVARLTSGSVAFTPAGSLFAPGGRVLLSAASSGSGGFRGHLRAPVALHSLTSPWYLSGRVYALDAGGRLWHSHDGGRSWRRSPCQGLPAATLELSAALRHSGKPDVLYAAAGRAGLWVSFDSGASFRRVSALDVTSVAATPAWFGELLAAGPGGLWLSANAGAHLRRVDGVRGVTALAIDPWNRRIAYAATAGGMLLRSVDGGGRFSAQAAG